MMKKLFLVFTAAVLASSMAFAKDKDVVTVEETFNADGEKVTTTTVTTKNQVVAALPNEHWFLGYEVGPQVYLGDNDKYMKFCDRIAKFPAMRIYAGKWFTPVWGFDFGVTYGKLRGAWKDSVGGYYLTDEFVTEHDGHNFYKQVGEMLNFDINARLSLINLFGGYKPNRVYNLVASLGAGYMIGFMHQDDLLDQTATLNFGLDNVFNVSNHVALNLKLFGRMFSDQFDGEGNGLTSKKVAGYTTNTPFDMIAGAQLGVLVNFGKRDWEYKTKVEQVTDNSVTKAALAASAAALVAMEKERNDLRAELDRILAENLNKVDGSTVWYHVQFAIDKSFVTRQEKVNLSAVADFMKANADKKFAIVGYADKQTATPKHNEVLSKNRAEAVAKILVDEFGVNPDQISVDYKGGVDTMFFNDSRLSRCVIVSNDK